MLQSSAWERPRGSQSTRLHLATESFFRCVHNIPFVMVAVEQSRERLRSGSVCFVFFCYFRRRLFDGTKGEGERKRVMCFWRAWNNHGGIRFFYFFPSLIFFGLLFAFDRSFHRCGWCGTIILLALFCSTFKFAFLRPLGWLLLFLSLLTSISVFQG